jgi:hypothetical protein
MRVTQQHLTDMYQAHMEACATLRARIVDDVQQQSGGANLLAYAQALQLIMQEEKQATICVDDRSD